MVLKLECFRKQIRSTLEVLKCGLEKMSLTGHVKNDVVVLQCQGGYEHPTQNKRKEGQMNRTHMPYEHITEGKTEGMRRQGRRRKQLVNELMDTRKYWNLKEEVPDCSIWRTRFGRGYVPVIMQVT
jgi:hypothetical protein